MADMLEYLAWRGDILFSQLGVNEVDALIFSTLSYIHYDGILTQDLNVVIPLETVYKVLMEQPEPQSCCRHEKDLELLQAAAESNRFGQVGVTFYRSVFAPQEETQFAAMTFLLDDGTALLAFRGTDSTLVGWKEDFNMSFRRSVPAQRLAQEYVQRYASFSPAPLYLAGHSKGGNLAVYAGAKCGELVRERILDVYNFDGPGFTQWMLEEPGYRKIVPRVKTFLPQFSVFGLMLEREEGYRVIRSDGAGLMQHEPYTWQVRGREFVPGGELNERSLFLDKTLTAWLEGLSNEERGDFFDSLFEILMQENANHPKDVLRPQNILAALKTIHVEEGKRRMLSGVLQDLVDTAKNLKNPAEKQQPQLTEVN